MRDDTWFVLGTGPSLEPFLAAMPLPDASMRFEPWPWPEFNPPIPIEPWRARTVGVNDIVRHITPRHLVVPDRPSDFKDQNKHDVLHRILESRPIEFWHCQAAWDEDVHPDYPLRRYAISHRMRLLRCDQPTHRPPPLDTAAPDELCFAYCSPYAAVHVAYRCGARRIGLVGVDFVGHPALKGDVVPKIDECFGMLHAALAERGVELVNLSECSALTTVPKVTVEAWVR